jgi:hypothetical protein
MCGKKEAELAGEAAISVGVHADKIAALTLVRLGRRVQRPRTRGTRSKEIAKGYFQMRDYPRVRESRRRPTLGSAATMGRPGGRRWPPGLTTTRSHPQLVRALETCESSSPRPRPPGHRERTWKPLAVAAVVRRRL